MYTRDECGRTALVSDLLCKEKQAGNRLTLDMNWSTIGVDVVANAIKRPMMPSYGRVPH